MTTTNSLPFSSNSSPTLDTLPCASPSAESSIILSNYKINILEVTTSSASLINSNISTTDTCIDTNGNSTKNNKTLFSTSSNSNKPPQNSYAPLRTVSDTALTSTCEHQRLPKTVDFVRIYSIPPHGLSPSNISTKGTADKEPLNLLAGALKHAKLVSSGDNRSVNSSCANHTHFGKHSPRGSASFHSKTIKLLDEDDTPTSSEDNLLNGNSNCHALPHKQKGLLPLPPGLTSAFSSEDVRPYRPRLDSQGNPIRRGSKTHSIAFVDEIKKSQNIEQVYEVESYKHSKRHSGKSCLIGCNII